jgi:hypothetical protein
MASGTNPKQHKHRPAASRARDRKPAPHDPEDTLGRGMSSEAAAEDEAETMASTGNSEGTFTDIVTGTATGLGIDRGESIGTGGLAAGEDLDEVAEGDYWRQNFERRPYYEAGRSYEHYEPGYRFGWQSAAGFGSEAVEFEDVETELEREWSYELASGEKDWEDVRQAVRDAWLRVRRRR